MEDIFARFKALPRPTKTYHTTTYPSISPTRPELSLAGKTVLITGGSEGIGLETAHAFAQAGASTIALLARRQERLDAAKSALQTAFPSTKILTFAASITDTPRLEALVKDLATIDILHLNAAQVTPGFTLSSPAESLTDSFAVNVFGPIALIKAFLALPPRSPDAERTILHTTTSGIQLTVPGMGLYNASKMAMTSLVHHLHEEAQVQGQKVRVFTFHPAFGFTPGARDVLGLREGQFDYDDLTLPAHYAVWLCSPEADFLRGRYTWAHWDVEEMKEKREEILRGSEELKVGVVVDSVKA
ncbi:hypothetical protein M409DRAFT_58983 [Zasmidium cellare ATCC 36951]|uniref:Ketoreductase domain-containing protein n=1 Tax=Zasmidium cellare ATCC 36951 TaxID=1080233 RepID=A0A6A6C5W7_ZASCE|nr:uncharacterized protein M409DRAFT_58983 [Zasmidium cellare ATCC 36951]KAF2161590.1 hypothetical protein M409DRAFT_58983 [Zasmidium cellare ATCC 36951]